MNKCFKFGHGTRVEDRDLVQTSSWSISSDSIRSVGEIAFGLFEGFRLGAGGESPTALLALNDVGIFVNFQRFLVDSEPPESPQWDVSRGWWNR